MMQNAKKTQPSLRNDGSSCSRSFRERLFKYLYLPFLQIYSKTSGMMRRKFGSIRVKIALAFCTLIVVAIFGTGYVLDMLIRDRLVKSEETAMINQINQTNDILELFYAIQLKKTDTLLIDTELLGLLTENYESEPQAIAVKRKILEKLERIAYDFRYPEAKGSNYFGGLSLMSLYVKNDTLYPSDYDIDGIYTTERIYSFERAQKSEWYSEMQKNEKTFYWESNIFFNGIQYIAFYRRLVDTDTLDDIAILRVCIPVAKVCDFILKNKVVDATALFYSDENYHPIFVYGDGKTISFLNKKFTDMNIKNTGSEKLEINGKKAIIYTAHSSLNDWNLTCVLPLSLVYNKIQFVTPIILLSLLTSAVLCIFVGTKISFYITNRINVLLQKTVQLSEGNFDIKGTVGGNDEITELNSRFIDMAQKIKFYGQEELKYKMMLEETKLELLQEQINPHLLYNTLSMIRFLAKKSNQLTIANLSSNLIGFYKRFLNEGQLISPITSELEMVRCFSEAIVTVYELDVVFRYSIDDDIDDLYSLKLFLQPIVENALIHGVRPNKSGTIEISCKREGNAINFTVTDNGNGIDEIVLERIRATMNDEIISEQMLYFGIYNVSKRIKLFFGERFGLTVDSTPGEGTTVGITIPALTSEQINDLILGKRTNYFS